LVRRVNLERTVRLDKEKQQRGRTLSALERHHLAASFKAASAAGWEAFPVHPAIKDDC
jgi:hypothetical protein